VRKLEFETDRPAPTKIELEEFLERTVSLKGISGKVDLSKRQIGKRICVIATKNDGTKYERKAKNNHALASIRNIFIKGDP